MEELKDDNTWWVKEYRKVTVRTSDGSTFSGKINLSHNKRISDLFKNPRDQFVVLTDVVFGDPPEKVIIINKNHIVWVEPGD
ncbi:MAG TPA: hypothetical protein PKV48_05070 [Thermodesulfobacteriota bacterium]|nr:hypothetical protein [Thermodesulfobacteriota bacterium]